MLTLSRRCLKPHLWRCMCSKHSDDATPPAIDQLEAPAEMLTKATVDPDEKPPPPEFQSDMEYYERKYKNYQAYKRDQAKHSYRPRTNPDETTVFLFPGQGAQFVGMGRDLLDYPGVEELYDIASQELGYDLLDLCLNGPKEKLDRTVHCQPATFVTSLAAVERLKAENPKSIEYCVTTAGFSVGEYAALVFSGAMSFQQAIRVLKVRAEAMQAASELTPSGMMSVMLNAKSKLKFALHTARQYCSKELGMENPVCAVANYLHPDCKVIAGHREALDFIKTNGRDFELRGLKSLPVSGAFHTPLMYPAKAALRKALDNADIAKPVIPVHSNVTSHRYRSVRSIRDSLSEQVYKPVMWEQTLHVVYSRDQGEGFPWTFEMGPGKQLGTLLRQVNRKAADQLHNVSG